MGNHSVRVLFVLLAVMACVGFCDEIFSMDATPAKPNVVFFLIDDLGWADLIPDWRKYLPCEETTIAEILKSAGYATAAVGKWHLGNEPYFPERQGFDLNVAGSNIGAPRSHFDPYGDRPKIPGGKPNEYLTDRLTDEALEFIAAHRSEPFFLYLSHYAVHTPIQAKPELVAKYRGKPASGGQKSPVYAAMVDSVDQSMGPRSAVFRIAAEIKPSFNRDPAGSA